MQSTCLINCLLFALYSFPLEVYLDQLSDRGTLVVFATPGDFELLSAKLKTYLLTPHPAHPGFIYIRFILDPVDCKTAYGSVSFPRHY